MDTLRISSKVQIKEANKVAQADRRARRGAGLAFRYAWMNDMKLEAQVTGNIGMYYACYKLSCMGWNVMPTARNARGIDIIAYNKNGTNFIGIQVKTLSKRNPVPLGNSLDKIMGDYWIVVNNVAKTPNAFIMLPKEIKKLAHRGEKDGNVSYWLQPNSYDTPNFKEAWHRIGHGHEMA